MVKSAAAGSGPDVSPIATSHVTSVCDDGEQTEAHKVILDSWILLLANARRSLEGWCWWNSNWTGSKCKTSRAAPFCELGPNVNTHLFFQIHHAPKLPILSGSHFGSSITV